MGTLHARTCSLNDSAATGQRLPPDVSGAGANFSRRSRPIRIAVVESDPVRFVGFSAVFHSKREFELRSSSIPEIIGQQDVDIVLLAISGRQHLFDRIIQLRSARPELRILATGTGMHDQETILKALAFGVKGCVDETAAAADFVKAIRAVHQGLVWAPRRACSSFIDLFTSRRPSRPPERNITFTDREKEVIEMLILGRSNKEISEALAIGERTVKGHLAKLMRKAGVRNRVELSVHAIARLLSPVN
jgi:DNA-binding NarL/FixJ family response regulator